MVRDGIEGIIVEPGDVEAIAAALEHLYRHPEIVRVEWGAAARQLSGGKFHLGPFSNTIAGCLCNRDANGAVISVAAPCDRRFVRRSWSAAIRARENSPAAAEADRRL